MFKKCTFKLSCDYFQRAMSPAREPLSLCHENGTSASMTPMTSKKIWYEILHLSPSSVGPISVDALFINRWASEPRNSVFVSAESFGDQSLGD